jgi:D-serine deaminase-like pyridoxal phosphate-dependent protein
MVDSVEHLDFVDAVIAPAARVPIRVCIELDASWLGPIGHIGVFRSPVHTPADARALAEAVVARPGFTLVGLMGYEAQIAGLVNNPAGQALRGIAVRQIQKRSIAELATRRGEAVVAVRQVADLEFVNGGGTGSLESTAADDSVTEIAAGSGLFGPHLFDNYTHFHPAPAASFALSVVRKPSPKLVALLGGGWIASGPFSADRSPRPVWPEGLATLPREGAGEVQTPLAGAAAEALKVGDRVWLRHTKAGEMSEHLDNFAVVAKGAIVETVPTYRGEGKVFL